MVPYSIPSADARGLDGTKRGGIYINDEMIGWTLLPMQAAETMANAWNAAAKWCQRSGAPHEVQMRRTLILAGHEADVTLIVGYSGEGNDVSLHTLRAYDESDYTARPLVLPVSLCDALLDDPEIYEACLDAWRALREHDRELAMAGE